VNATGRPMPIPVLAAPCPTSDDDGPHQWQLGDLADLVDNAHPDGSDHGVTVWLGRCQHCDVPLLAVTALAADDVDGAAWYETPGARL
jgi:hypothetical protein